MDFNNFSGFNPKRFRALKLGRGINSMKSNSVILRKTVVRHGMTLNEFAQKLCEYLAGTRELEQMTVEVMREFYKDWKQSRLPFDKWCETWER